MGEVTCEERPGRVSLLAHHDWKKCIMTYAHSSIFC
jgi:hypothetical protein